MCIRDRMETVGAGDICAAVGFKEIRTGDTLCAENAPIVLEQMTFPEPVIGLSVEPKTQKDLDKLGIALSKLAVRTVQQMNVFFIHRIQFQDIIIYLDEMFQYKPLHPLFRTYQAFP